MGFINAMCCDMIFCGLLRLINDFSLRVRRMGKNRVRMGSIFVTFLKRNSAQIFLKSNKCKVHLIQVLRDVVEIICSHVIIF